MTTTNTVPESLVTPSEQALDFAQQQVRKLITTHPDYFPLFTQGGHWKHGQEAWTNWCEGFLGGMMWIFARRTGDAWWRERAEHYSRLIEHRKQDRTVHDLGFLFWPTWKAWYDLTGDNAINAVVIEAGKTLSLRSEERRVGKGCGTVTGVQTCALPILMWIFARRTGDAWWRERAEHYSRLIEHRKQDRTVHDLGFLFWPTWKAWYDLTGDNAINAVVIEAGKTLSL